MATSMTLHNSKTNPEIVVKRKISGATHWVDIQIGDFELTVFGKPNIDMQCTAFGDNVKDAEPKPKLSAVE